LLGTVLDRLAGQLPAPAVENRELAAMLDGMAGTARVYALPGGRAGYLWASRGTDHYVRTVQARYPAADAGDLPDLILRVAFYPLAN
jgi:hypothetical protein